MPNEIVSNEGNTLGENTCYVSLGNEDINTLKLKWENSIYGYTQFSSTNILEIDFSNSKIISMRGIFDSCTSLTSINFSNLITSTIKEVDYAFKSCTYLKSIDLTNLDLSSVTNFANMFYNCQSLEYINFFNYNESQVKGKNYLTIDNKVPANLVICLDKAKAPKLYSELMNRNCTVIYCESDWKNKQKKIVYTTDECVDSCESTINYKYKYESYCLPKCPKNYTANSQNICEKGQIKEKTTILIETEIKKNINLLTDNPNNNILENTDKKEIIQLTEMNKINESLVGFTEKLNSYNIQEINNISIKNESIFEYILNKIKDGIFKNNLTELNLKAKYIMVLHYQDK